MKSLVTKRTVSAGPMGVSESNSWLPREAVRVVELESERSREGGVVGRRDVVGGHAAA
jgi:hypothetical protein